MLTTKIVCRHLHVVLYKNEQQDGNTVKDMRFTLSTIRAVLGQKKQ